MAGDLYSANLRYKSQKRLIVPDNVGIDDHKQLVIERYGYREIHS